MFTCCGIHTACAVLTGLACVTRAIDANTRFTRLAHRAFRTAREGFFAQNTQCTTTGIGLFTFSVFRAFVAQPMTRCLLVRARNAGQTGSLSLITLTKTNGAFTTGSSSHATRVAI